MVLTMGNWLVRGKFWVFLQRFVEFFGISICFLQAESRELESIAVLLKVVSFLKKNRLLVNRLPSEPGPRYQYPYWRCCLLTSVSLSLSLSLPCFGLGSYVSTGLRGYHTLIWSIILLDNLLCHSRYVALVLLGSTSQ